jgi:hypothetical protein
MRSGRSLRVWKEKSEEPKEENVLNNLLHHLSHKLLFHSFEGAGG